MTTQLPPGSALPTTPPKRRGCLFYGCITVVLLIVVTLGGLYWGVSRFIKGTLTEWSDTAPLQLPVVTAAPGVYEATRSRVEEFIKAIEANQPAAPLVLTAEEINALIAGAPELGDVRGRVYISIPGDEVEGQVSLPLAGFGLADRYVNGRASFAVSHDYGVLVVTLKRLEVNGKLVPDTFMNELGRENLAAEFTKDATRAEALRRIEKIEVADGRIIVTPKDAVAPEGGVVDEPAIEEGEEEVEVGSAEAGAGSGEAVTLESGELTP